MNTPLRSCGRLFSRSLAFATIFFLLPLVSAATAHNATEHNFAGPTITNAVTGTGHLRAGNVLTITIIYNASVFVTGGTSSIPITLNSGTVNAVYASGSATNQLAFRYTVTGTDEDDDGIVIGNTIALNGGSIRDGSSNDASVTFTAPDGSNTFIDNIAPTVSSLAVKDANPTKSATVRYTLTFSENIFNAGLDANDFTVVTTGGVTGMITGIANSNGGISAASAFVVTVTGVSGTGTLRVDLNSSGTGIEDQAHNPLSGGVTGDTYNIDNTAPGAPINLALAAGSDSGTPNDNITNVTTPTIIGLAENNSTVTLYDTGGTTPLGSGAVTDGSFSITTTALSPGDHSITAKATDGVGNTGIASAVLLVTINTTIPRVILSPVPNVEETSTSFTVSYSDASGSPNLYSVTTAATNVMPGFSPISNFSLNVPNPVSIPIPATAAGTYDFIFSVRNQAAGNSSVDIPFSVTVNAPPPPATVSLTGTLTAFESCAGSPSAEQSFKVSGTNLTADVIIDAPSGFEISKTTGSGFGSQLTFTETAGVVSQQDIFVRIAATATGTPGGDITIKSTGAADEAETISGTVNDLPVITPGAVNPVTTTATTFILPYSGVPAGSYIYFITTGARAIPGFSNVNGFTLVPTVSVNLPSGLTAGTYDFNLSIENTATGCISAVVPFTLLVQLSNNIKLSTFKVIPSAGSLTIVPGPHYRDYQATIYEPTTSIQIQAFTQDATATLTINGASVASGTPSDPIHLNPDTTTIYTTVTAGDGVTRKTYAMTVTLKPSNNAKLTSFKLSPSAALTAVAGTDYRDYTATVRSATSSISILAISQDATATITVNGVPATSGIVSSPIHLNVDTNTIYTTVTAADGVTKKTYAIKVTRPPSNNALLATFTTTPKAALTAVPGTDYRDYEATILNPASSISIIAAPQDATATFTVNGIPGTSGTASDPINLNADTTTIYTTVTAGDGVTKKTYALKVTRQASNNAVLTTFTTTPKAALTAVAGTDYRDYVTTVDNSTSSISIFAVVQNTTSAITVNGAPATSGTASDPVHLNVDTNTIYTTVTAGDGVTKKTYAILITRAAPPGLVMKYEAPDETLATGGEIVVHQNVSPNGDGRSDGLLIEGIAAHPDNRLQIMSRSGNLVYEAKGYDNTTKIFDGHASNGKLQQAGTYFYSLEYKDGSEVKHKTGFFVLKY